MKKFLALCLALLIAFGAAGCAAPANPGGQGTGSASSADGGSETIKIGQLAALTGSSAPYGIPEANAAKMFVDRINAEGGVLGKQIELITYDSKGDQSECINAAKRLIADGVCAIIGPSQSGQAIALVPICEEAGVPFISTGATNPNVTVDPNRGEVYHTAFRACFIDTFQGAVASQFCLNELHAKTAAVVYDVGSDFAAGLKEFFEADFTENGGTIVTAEGYRTGELDFRAILGKVKEFEPDVIFSPSSPNEGGLMIQQANDLGLDCEWVGGDAWSSIDLVNAGGEYAEGTYMIGLAATDDPNIQTWLEEYIAEFGADPVLPAPIFVTDALTAVCHAINAADSADPGQIIEQLEKIKDLDVLSGKLTFDPATHNPLNKPAIIQVVRDGEIVFYKLIEAVG